MTDRDDLTMVDLRMRVDRLERLVVRTGMVVTWVLLGVGVFLPFASTVDGSGRASKVMDLGVAVFPIQMVRYLSGPESADDDFKPLGIAMGIGFLGLFLVVLIGAFALASGWGASATRRTARVLRIAAVLAAIGTVVVWILGLMAASADDSRSAMHPVVPIALSIGVLGLLAWSGTAGRAWWVAADTAAGDR